MNTGEHPHDASESEIEAQSAAWLARRDRGLSADEQDRFLHWLAADSRHGEWFARHQQTMRELGALVQWRPEHAAQPNPDLLAAAGRAPSWLRPMALAAAAAVALAIFLWQREGWRMPEENGRVADAPAPIEQLRLPDGSAVELNRGAVVSVEFSPTERLVRLVRGEAHFTVAKGQPMPFVVAAADVRLRAVGTAFNVSLRHATVEVLVTEGKVAVDKLGVDAAGRDPRREDLPAVRTPAPVLEAGQSVAVPVHSARPIPAAMQVSPEEISRRLAWQPRMLEYTAAPLAEIVAELNRDNALKLVIADPALSQMPIGASLRSDNVEGLVRLLEASFSVEAERQRDVIVLRRAKPAQPGR